MRKHTILSAAVAAFAALALMGCPPDNTGGPGTENPSTGGGDAAAPSFSLAWSEYPSWSTFGVASELKLVDGAKGAMGEIEKKWNVDIVLNEADYDGCLTQYGSGACDAVCITNMDILSPALGRPSVAVLPTSTSKGGDALIVGADINAIADLKGKKVHGLEKSVSEYCFVRNLEEAGEKEADYMFSNMGPDAAALAFQQKQADVEAIVVWNPYVLDTLNKRPDAKVLFDSSTIPGEIIDMVVVAKKSLEMEGGDRFAAAVIETFYRINELLDDPKQGDETLVALGEKFSNLDLASMKKVVTQTVFYKNHGQGKGLYTGNDIKKVMEKVVAFSTAHGMVDKAPKIAYGKKDAADADLLFDTSYIELYIQKK